MSSVESDLNRWNQRNIREKRLNPVRSQFFQELSDSKKDHLISLGVSARKSVHHQTRWFMGLDVFVLLVCVLVVTGIVTDVFALSFISFIAGILLYSAGFVAVESRTSRRPDGIISIIPFTSARRINRYAEYSEWDHVADKADYYLSFRAFQFVTDRQKIETLAKSFLREYELKTFKDDNKLTKEASQEVLEQIDKESSFREEMSQDHVGFSAEATAIEKDILISRIESDREIARSVY